MSHSHAYGELLDPGACSIVMTARMEGNVTYEHLTVLANLDSQDFFVMKHAQRETMATAAQRNVGAKMMLRAIQ